jgi:ribonuclease J
MTAFIAKAMQDSAPQDIEKEVCYSNPRILRDGYRTPDKNEKLRQRPFSFLDCPSLSPGARKFWDKSPMKTKELNPCPAAVDGRRIGSLPLRYFPVDHSIPGACSFAVETSVGWVGYTGDLRLHGRRGEQTQRAVEEMGALHPRILICEGTRAGEDGGASEDEVHSTALKYTRKNVGQLVIADFGPRNVDRLLIFRAVAEDTHRRLVILAKDAYLLESMSYISDDIPDLEGDPDILIYEDLKAMTGTWERELRERYAGKMVEASGIRAHPGDYILCFSFWDLKNLIDIFSTSEAHNKPQGGLYIFSTSEAHNEEQQLDVWRLSNWIDHFNLTARGLPRGNKESRGEDWEVPQKEMGLHASGHAGGDDLLSIVRGIAPRILIPIHSLDPGFYVRELKDPGIMVKLPERCGKIVF